MRQRRFFQWRLCTVMLVLVCAALWSTTLFAADSKPFTMIALPDTQFYAEKFPETYQIQTEWIVENAEAENLKYVIHLGDIVQHCDVESQWKVADRAHQVLDEAKIPYSVLPGNHDVWGGAAQKGKKIKDTRFYDQYFGLKRFEGRTEYAGHFGDSNLNNLGRFEVDGMKFLVVNLEYKPSDEVLAWADQVVKQNADRRVIVVTHAYLTRGKRSGIGNRIWEKLIRKNPNIFLVFCGHVCDVSMFERTNDAGGKVYEVLTDLQAEANGGNGWLTLIRFCPKENLIKVRLYSPTLKKCEENPKRRFDLKYEMTPAKKAAA